MPWQTSYAASFESDSAELQTDVMRFMAILAFCLVAIFAIVQSIPATPAPVADEDVAARAPAPEPPVPLERLVVEQRVAATVVEPVRQPEPVKTLPVVLQRAKPVAVKKHDKPVQLRHAVPQALVPRPRTAPIAVPPAPRATLAPAPDAQPPAPQTSAPVEQGLSLRFESDATLRSLVARGLVNLYAISGSTYYKMDVVGSGVRFQPGTAPAQYHEMIADTVPGDVRRSFAASASPVTWGVTLPAATSQQLARFVRTNYTGSLVITADAQLALAARGGV